MEIKNKQGVSAEALPEQQSQAEAAEPHVARENQEQTHSQDVTQSVGQGFREARLILTRNGSPQETFVAERRGPDGPRLQPGGCCSSGSVIQASARAGDAIAGFWHPLPASRAFWVQELRVDAGVSTRPARFC